MPPHDTNLDPPAVTSYPQDPGRPSFLDRPPEIRNAIYEALFLIDGPITIKRAKSTTPVPGIKLLSICRQIHKEASGVLYSRNIFKVIAWYIPLLYTNLVGEWLQSIGMSKNLLRVLNIDISNFCSDPDSWAHTTIELLPILAQTVLSDPPGRLQISFIEEAGRSRDACDGICEQLGIKNLNSSFKSLYIQQTFELRPYLRCLRSIKSFEIMADGSEIKLTFGDNHLNWAEETAVSFAATRGQFRRIASTKQPTDLTDILSTSLGPTILNSVAPINFGTVHNVNDETGSGTSLSIMQVNRAIRGIGEYLYTNRVLIVELSTENTEDRFNAFTLLEDWAYQRLSPRPNYRPDHDLESNFATKNCKSFASKSFKATDLVRSTHSLQSNTELRFRMIDSDDNTWYIESLTDLHTLRFNLLAFFAYLIRSYPSRLLLPCPIVWADCDSDILHAEFEGESGGTMTVTNKLVGRKWSGHRDVTGGWWGQRDMQTVYREEIMLVSRLQEPEEKFETLLHASLKL